jgi:hypothetical protein
MPARKREDGNSDDLAVLASDARRKANASGDTADRQLADDLDAELTRQGAVPDWRAPTESVAKATEIVSQFGDGLDADDVGAWSNLTRLLGYPLSELASIAARGQGVFWKVASSGAWYIAVGEQNRPDADGKRGIMLWEPPPRYEGPFPLYARTPTAAEPGEPPRLPPQEPPPGT